MRTCFNITSQYTIVCIIFYIIIITITIIGFIEELTILSLHIFLHKKIPMLLILGMSWPFNHVSSCTWLGDCTPCSLWKIIFCIPEILSSFSFDVCCQSNNNWWEFLIIHPINASCKQYLACSPCIFNVICMIKSSSYVFIGDLFFLSPQHRNI